MLKCGYFSQWIGLVGVGMEDNVEIDGVSYEIEREWYAEVTPEGMEYLKQNASDVVAQSQWSVRMNGSQIRVRKSLVQGETVPTYELTFKGPATTDGKRPESNVVIDEQFYDGFKNNFADSGMIKTRYSLPFTHGTETLTWEVDVYEGTNWVKIDLEITPNTKDVPVEFPFETKRSMSGGKDDKRTEADQKLLDELYDNYFIAKIPGKEKSLIG